MARFVLISVVVAVCLAGAQGYGSGAPKDACGDMVPQHHTPAQTSPFPYTVSANKKTIRAGDKVTLLISPGASVKDFKGFFIQARVGDTPVGKFSAGDGVKVIDCGTGKGNAATHSKADSKTKVAIQWTAPPNLSETVKFYATVAKNGGEFWVKQLGASVAVKKSRK